MRFHCENALVVLRGCAVVYLRGNTGYQEVWAIW